MEARIVGKQKLRVVWSCLVLSVKCQVANRRSFLTERTSGTINSDFCDRKSCRLVCNDVQYEQCALSCFNSISS